MDMSDEMAADVNGRLHVIVSAAIGGDVEGFGRGMDGFERAYGRPRMWLVACGLAEYARLAVQVIGAREGLDDVTVLPCIDDRTPQGLVFASRFLSAWCSGDHESAHALYSALESWPEDQWGDGLATLGVITAQVMRSAYGEVQ